MNQIRRRPEGVLDVEDVGGEDGRADGGTRKWNADREGGSIRARR